MKRLEYSYIVDEMEIELTKGKIIEYRDEEALNKLGYEYAKLNAEKLVLHLYRDRRDGIKKEFTSPQNLEKNPHLTYFGKIVKYYL